MKPNHWNENASSDSGPPPVSGPPVVQQRGVVSTESMVAPPQAGFRSEVMSDSPAAPPLPSNWEPTDSVDVPEIVDSDAVDAQGLPAEDEGLTADWQQQRIRRMLHVGLIGRSLRWLVLDQPSWLTSFLTHALILLLLAMMLIQKPAKVNHLTLSFSDTGEETLQVDSISIEPAGSQPNESPLPVNEVTEVQPVTVPEVVMAPLPTIDDLVSLPANLAATQIGETSASAPGGISGRRSRRGMAQGLGATPASEAAVDRALAWIADHQTEGGYWTFDLKDCGCNGACRHRGIATQAHNGATAMALLPFLGAGYTHERGPYQETVRDGLLYLIKKMERSKGNGFLEPMGDMYSHGLATLALCEALAMTTSDPGARQAAYRKQPRLRRAATRAVKFIEKAQHPQGGWRYKPGQRGDTSVVGWQMMALKSAEMAGVQVSPKTYQKTDKFLNSVQSGEYNQFYGYTSNTPRPGTTAIGLLCRMYRGWNRDHMGAQAGVEYLVTVEKPARENVYYNYYATQVIHHYGGPMWEAWHPVLRDYLVNSQATGGHEAGSWYFDDSIENAGVLSGGINTVGGRLYVTSMSTMILEVYYRHMPIYSRMTVPEPQRLELNLD